jgi:hypothetical protein
MLQKTQYSINIYNTLYCAAYNIYNIILYYTLRTGTAQYSRHTYVALVMKYCFACIIPAQRTAQARAVPVQV